MASLERHVVMVPRPVTLPDSIMNMQLRTVEDVDRFFRMFTQSTDDSSVGRAPPFRFVYCAKLDTGLRFRPYDIVVVRRGEQPRDHYVVSSQAVVHVTHNEASEITSIEDWIRASKQFDQLRSLKFFRTYLLHKMLRRWRENISFAQYLQARAKLGKKLFLSKETFAKATTQLRKLAFDVRLEQPPIDVGKLVSRASANPLEGVGERTYPIRLLSFPETRPAWGYTKDEFLEAQRTHFANVTAYFTRCFNEAKQIITTVVDTVAEKACVPDINTMEQLDQYLALGSEARGTIGALAKQEKDMERQQRKRELKRRIVEYDFLLPWIRLVDVMFTTELYRNLVFTFCHLAKHLDLPHCGFQRDLRVSFQVGVIYRDEEPLKFVPACQEVDEFVLQYLQEVVNSVSCLPRVVDLKEFRMHFYRQPVITPIAESMRTCTSYADSTKAISKIVHRDFDEAFDKSKVYDPCRQWLLFLTREWPVEYESWAVRTSEKAPKDQMLTESDIKRFISKVAKGRSDMAKLSNKHSGILSINIEPLVADISGRLDAVLNDIKTTLLAFASRRVNDVSKDLEVHIATLKAPGLELREFAEWVERCNSVERASRAVLQECADADNLYVIAEDNGFESPQHHRDKRDRTVGMGKGGELPLHIQLTDAMAASRAFREQHGPEIKQQLEIAITDTVGVLGSITDELKHGEYREASRASSQILPKLQGVQNTLQSLKLKKDTLNHYCDLLEIVQPPWESMAKAVEAYDAKQELWTTLARWEERRGFWNHTPVSQLNGEDLKNEMLELYQKAHKLNKADPDSVTDRLINAITVEKANLNVMVELCNPALKEEHWVKIFDGIGKRLPPAEGRTLETLRTFGAYQHADLINSISAVATGEYSLLAQVNKIILAWDQTEFVLVKNRDQTILGGLDDILLQLEDHQVQIQTCLASRYVAGIKTLVESWDVKLQRIADVLEAWVEVQKSWMYLEFIFSSDDIKKQLPEESRMFIQVDKTFKKLMAQTEAANNIANIATQETLLDDLRKSTEHLDKIQKRLEDYLETKRVAFPRFYFLSNDELLAILSDVRNPTAVQPHLQKCFDNIKELDFESASVIRAMRSTEGEVVTFSEKTKVVGNVENWLNDIERMMRRTLYDITGQSVEAYPKSTRVQWFFDFPAQVTLCVDQIEWTSEVEEVFRKISGGNPNALTEYLDSYKLQILDTVNLVKTKLTKLQRTCVCTLIVVDVHNRDVINFLVDEHCTDAAEFSWSRQLRYYWSQEGDDTRPDCHIHHSAARISYGYEYLGNQPRLVITPLTERAFLTCTSAIHINQGGAPQGPAGTGKTESVKDLGKGLARQVVVFNCSDGLNYKTMSRMFAGLAQAGAWACFDEFNRIEIEVLSVVAQQMLEITTAIANKQPSMMFDGHRIRLHKNFGVFITMNPGYAGRTELPDNLKALFRPICMMIPDYALIAEIMFFSEGFENAKPLAQKMVRLYSLASQQLSKQDHYDFGMRAVKSILS